MPRVQKGKKVCQKENYEENVCLKVPDVFFWRFLLKLRASLNGDQRRNMLYFSEINCNFLFNSIFFKILFIPNFDMDQDSDPSLDQPKRLI